MNIIGFVLAAAMAWQAQLPPGVEPWVGDVRDYEFPVMTDWYGVTERDTL